MMLQRLLSHLRSVAPDHVEIPILQPADPFLETAGEDLRWRIFITESIDGQTHCLRPEFTIPICLSHLALDGRDGAARRYAYGGSVFRQARQGAAEFRQAGLEDLGNPDKIAADAASIGDLLETLAVAGIDKPHLTLGDQGLFAVVVKNLGLPRTIAERLVRGFGSPHLLDEQISRLSQQNNNGGSNSKADRLAIDGDEAALIAHVEELMADGNLAPGAGRSAAAIAQRMLEKSAESHFRLGNEDALTLRRFLDLEVPLTDAADHLTKFSGDTGIDFGDAGETFLARLSALERAGVNVSRTVYKASFGRNLEYYTGVLFEAHAFAGGKNSGGGGSAIAGGGRYDRLCELLGSPTAVPAVGFSISLDRVEAVL